MTHINTTNSGDFMYRIYLSNHGYFAGNEFTTFQEALTWAKGNSFEVSIWHDDEIVASWGPLEGTTLLNQRGKK